MRVNTMEKSIIYSRHEIKYNSCKGIKRIKNFSQPLFSLTAQNHRGSGSVLRCNYSPIKQKERVTALMQIAGNIKVDKIEVNETETKRLKHFKLILSTQNHMITNLQANLKSLNGKKDALLEKILRNCSRCSTKSAVCCQSKSEILFVVLIYSAVMHKEYLKFTLVMYKLSILKAAVMFNTFGRF